MISPIVTEKTTNPLALILMILINLEREYSQCIIKTDFLNVSEAYQLVNLSILNFPKSNIITTFSFSGVKKETIVHVDVIAIDGNPQNENIEFITAFKENIERIIEKIQDIPSFGY